MEINPYINFPGNCTEALAAYADIFGGAVTFTQTFGETPMAGDIPPEMHGMVMHAVVEIGGRKIMASDAPPDRYQKPQGNYISVQMDDRDAAQAAFDRLAAGGAVEMPFQKTFWAQGFGMTTDRFGIPWMINCGGPD